MKASALGWRPARRPRPRRGTCREADFSSCGRTAFLQVRGSEGRGLCGWSLEDSAEAKWPFVVDAEGQVPAPRWGNTTLTVLSKSGLWRL